MKKLLLSFLILASHHLFAAELEGVEFAETYKLGDSTLVLNGMGMRLATFVKVKVYAAGLYLEAKTSDGEKIIASDTKKVVRMVFKRDVDADVIQESWTEGFEKQCKKKELKTLLPSLAQLNALMSDMKDGEEMLYTFDQGTVEVFIGGASRGKVENNRMAQLLLGCWIGPKPPNKELKAGMLGKWLLSILGIINRASGGLRESNFFHAHQGLGS
ncbi:chalcone isomerase family protein [Pontiella sulfatireligans]|uniref:Chalcone isomerase domain-containing protein n=1 Tax=Pontiella sulfatireligans TaxID=2750658 RepID=A0A6C2USJ9_9BACT|nr:chalcone isomerase family protein [Pontiella sulfatireligans]VGO22197.1 hypothetical protein SCARR_04279 [Pontiella sulfatireligans]